MHSSQSRYTWAFRFASFVERYGTLKLSLFFVLLTLGFTIGGSYVIRVSLDSEPTLEDFMSAIILTMLSAPWVLYFFSELVKQLEHSRAHLKEVIEELESLREEDVLLNKELQNNIKQLNYEIEQRRNAQLEREKVFEELEREIRDKSEQEIQARRLSMLLRSIIDASPDLIYYRNEEGKFAGCNRVAEDLTGRTQDELLGLTPHQVYDEELARQVVTSDNEVLEKNVSLTEELWLRFHDGRRRYFEMRKVPFFDHDGNRLGLLAFGRDMTERMKAEKAAEQASKDKTKFIATISHELRTPLNGIVGLSRMLRDTKLNDEQFGWVSTIYASAITLGNIFNDIIDLDKLERDKIELSYKTLSLATFTEELGSVIKLLAADKNLGFRTIIHEPLPKYVMVDGTRLRQILWNILFNAVKFTAKGHVSLAVEATNIDNTRANVRFIIEDTGVGIPQADIDKIFAMYYQVDHPDHQSATGTGIGLAICKEMVERMDGHIKVTSEVGKGTRFIVEIPLEISHQERVREELEVSGLNILLVEDIELNVMVAKALLEKLGMHVDVAMTGGEAIDKIRSTRYDLILLDIQLPDMTGFDVADTVIHEDLVMQTPIVALTANVIKKREEYLQNGMDDVIAKPIKKSRVIQVFNELFANNIDEFPVLPVEEPESDKGLDKIMDTELVRTLADTIGAEMVTTSLAVFEEKIPEYLEILQTNLAAKEKDEVCSQAHKIKGAASSLGLIRIQRIANEIQQGDHPAWWENVNEWVDDLEAAIANDVGVLKEWMAEQSFAI
ncbi:aerobic respiration two-component sensor histidine kinase ArcB [Alteromonas sp. LMIT006]|jgi:two-component system aerobic respiration control sensor histidine kinase ArcB|uniref:aerobic respiration two-component sensor histidine kinase ArcB n=1 Tax=Alteromonadaceae TaxID=72275 RepID=UPI0020CA2FDC|nr:aerobic respiration two-component sensor histidine kinase ArcB [Alteromonas sp. LMIT006]UTP72708.1 aerobic respiration two-component sensor histidine kinase ArcB [Alteromonas sp. LMIT006]